MQNKYFVNANVLQLKQMFRGETQVCFGKSGRAWNGAGFSRNEAVKTQECDRLNRIYRMEERLGGEEGRFTDD
jgi:hypothetical protein